MSNEELTSGSTVTISDAQPGTAETTVAPQDQGAGSAAPEGQQSTDGQEAGASQERTEDGQSQPGRGRKWTPIDEIRDLRAWRREARQREMGYQSQIQQITQQLEELRQLQQPGQGKTARNPAEFWQDPEAALARNLDERLENLEGRLMERISMSREMEAQQVQVRQEQESAVEFIRSQSTYAPEDDEDLIDIIESIPQQTRATLSPQWVAEYAWMKLMQERGVGNRSQAKARASTVIGQPPGAGLSGKVWNKAEFDRAVDALEKQGAKADQKLLDELMSAAKEGRVR